MTEFTDDDAIVLRIIAGRLLGDDRPMSASMAATVSRFYRLVDRAEEATRASGARDPLDAGMSVAHG